MFIAMASIRRIRHLHVTLFVGIHIILALLAIATLFLHLWLIRAPSSALLSKILMSVAALLWALGYIHRYTRSQDCHASIEPIHDAIFRHRGGRVPSGGACFITVQLPREVLVYPGAYFYLHFSRAGLHRLRGEPMMAYGWQPANSADGWRRNCQLVKELTFLVEDRAHHSVKLSIDSIGINVEGPYGRDLSLHNFDTVTLVAEGSGIAGVMPLGLALAERKCFDQEIKQRRMSLDEETGLQLPHSHLDKTIRLNIIWVLRHAYELNWIKTSLKQLSRMDPKQVSTFAQCMFDVSNGI